jgi:hypothetical protein
MIQGTIEWRHIKAILQPGFSKNLRLTLASCLQILWMMKHYIKTQTALASLLVMFSLICASASRGFGQQNSLSNVSAKDKQAIAVFEKSVKDYVALREGLEDKMAKLSEKSTPEQIEAHKKAFEDIVRTARVGAKQGDLFNPIIAQYIRATIRDEFKGKDRQELRKMVLEADTKGVPLKVNYPYPDNKELLEMPPTLLLRLPQLPKQVKYRFVNRHMLLVDRENGLIVDYMIDALP